MTYKATRISITAEKLLEDGIIKIVEEAGATGYTVIEGSGKGAHGLRTRDRPAVVGAFSIVKIEVVTADHDLAERIAEKVSTKYFGNYSGIVYLDEVEIFRPKKFGGQ
jgi:nitrogen regulatory protein PII